MKPYKITVTETKRFAVFTFPNDFFSDTGYQKNDDFLLEAINENKLILYPVVHFSRFQREKRKFKRRFEKHGINFRILKSNKVISCISDIFNNTHSQKQ